MRKNQKTYTTKQLLKVNQQIKAREVRLIDDKGNDIGVMLLSEAIKQAMNQGVDVIEVQPNAIPPVAKLMNYSKYIYRLSKTSRKQQKTKAGLLKGVRFRFKTSGNDLNIKAKKTKAFLEKGFKVKVQIILIGREKMFKNELKEKIKTFLELIGLETIFDKEITKDGRGYNFTLRIKSAN